MLLRLILPIIAVWAAAVLGLVLLQRRILFQPDRARPDLDRAGVPGLREMTVTTEDGLDLLAWYLPPRGNDDRILLYLHGNAGHLGHRAFRLTHYQRLGWGVLLVEYRGYGGNPGLPSEAGLIADARAGMAALLEMGFAPDRVLLWGESLGTGVAVALAADRDVAAIILEAPYTSITAMAYRRFPFAPARWLLWDHFDTLAVIGAVRAPVLVIHGARDRIIPVSMGRAVFDAAPRPKRLWIIPTAGHLDLVDAGAIEVAGEFVREMCPTPAPRSCAHGLGTGML